MFLRRLKEYADERMDLPPTLYTYAPVRYIIELDEQGDLLSSVPTDTATDQSDRATRRGKLRPVPQVKRNHIQPFILADHAEYALGLPRDKDQPDRAREYQKSFLHLLDRCVAETNEATLRAVQLFLNGNQRSHLKLPEDFNPNDTITFRVNNIFPVDLPSVQRFWAKEHGALYDPKAKIMQCLVCEKHQPIERTLKKKIKGIPGGQPAGTALISADKGAFESYGLEKSLIAPTCSDCGEKFTEAINHLIAREESNVRFQNLVFIFWTRDSIPFSVMNLLSQPDESDVQALIESVHSGKPWPEVDSAAFYGAALSSSGGRAVVRDWIDTTVGDVKRHLARWFDRQRIIQPDGYDPRFNGVYGLANSTVRERKDLAATTPRALLRSALTNMPLQWDLVYQAVRRNRVEQRITGPRASLIKLVMLSQEISEKEDYMVKLDPNHPSAAYQCGRLLAPLEQAQRLAITSIKATIVDRFFGTASSAPASVFGNLIRNAQPHLSKLQRDNPPAYHALQQRLEGIMAEIGSFPVTLNLKEQALFALGYYHQRAHDRAQARSHRQTDGTPPMQEAQND